MYISSLLKEHDMEILFNIIHWVTLGLTFYLGLRLFRDLADVSQWFVRTSRKMTMDTFYNRHKLAGLIVVSISISALTMWTNGVGNIWAFSVIGILSFFLFFTGYINPRFMMRSQQNGGCYYTINDAKDVLTNDTSLIVMEVGGVAKAHPDEHVLRPHVVSSKEAPDDEDIVMTYCGLTNMGIAYKPEINGKSLDLGVMTQLENNLVMWDKNTGEPIQQFWGTLESTGPHGPRMEEWPSFRMPLWAFEKEYPEGKVFLNKISPLYKNPVLAIYDNIIHLIFKHAVGKQAIDEAPAFPTIKKFDERLPNKEKVYGVNVGVDYVAYTKKFIQEQGDLFSVKIGGKDIVVAYHQEFDSVGMYVNKIGKPINKISLGGKSGLEQLPRLETMKSEAYWVVWQNFFPQTDVNRAASL
jgi:hypothetical protein